MKKIKALVVFCLILTFVFSMISYAATGSSEKTEKFLDENEAFKAKEKKDDCYQRTSSESELTEILGNDKIKKIKEFKFDIDKVKTVRIEKKSSDESIYRKYEIDTNQFIILDQNDEVISICNVKTKDENKVLKKDKKEIEKFADKIAKYYELGSDYVVSLSEAFDDDYWNLTWIKVDNQEATNPYDSVKVTIDRSNLSVVFLSRFNVKTTTKTPVLTEKEVVDSLKENSYFVDFRVEDIELTYAYPNEFFNEMFDITQKKSLHLVYQVKANNNSYTVNIDAITGKVIGGDKSKSECVGSYGQTNAGLAHSGDSVNLAADGMIDLGYSPSYYKTLDTSSLRSYVTTHINRSDAYAFYFCGHGTSSTTDPRISIEDKNDVFNAILYSSEVVGNWHFVFLDACYTGRSIWASSFNITSSTSDRAYLGWDGTAGTTAAYDFAQEFWPIVGTMSIRDAAVYAANQVPGSGTTPIRFFGDSTYDGTPH